MSSTIASEVRNTPPCNITLESSVGKRAIIDFGGDAVAYPGDLPVEESARLFFDAVFGIYAKENLHKRTDEHEEEGE